MESSQGRLQDRVDKLQAVLESCRESLEAQRRATETLRLNVALLRQERLALTVPGPGLNSGTIPQRRHRRLRAVPYVVLIAAGAGFGLQGSLLTGSKAQAASAPRYRPLSPTISLSAPAALDQGVAEAEIDESGEALRLVYESKAPGSQASVLELLGPIETPAARSPWEVDRFDESGYLVTFREPDGAAAYEFETDTAAGAVRPSAETARRLAALALNR